MALKIQSQLLTRRTVGEGDVVVGDFIEEVDLFLFQEQTSSNRVYWGIAPSFIEEAAIAVKRFEVIHIWLGSEPFQVSDFEIRPLLIRFWLVKLKSQLARYLRNGTCCRFFHRRRSRSPLSSLPQYVQGDCS